MEGGEGGGGGGSVSREISSGQKQGKNEERKVVLKVEKEKEPMVLGQLSAGVTNFLSGFTFPRNKKKISMTNSLGKQQRKKSGCRSNSGERGRYGMLVTNTTMMTRDEGEEDLRTSNRIRSVHNLIGSSSNNVSHSGRSRERRMSSSSATGGGGGRKSDGSTSDQQQQQQNRKLVRIIDHQLDW